MSLADIISPPQLYTFDAREEVLRDEPPFADSLIVEVDVTLSEEYEQGFEVSTNPVEEGIDVTDHKRAKPRILRMSGIVSDSPNNFVDALAGIANNLTAPAGDMTTRSHEAYKKLEKIAAQAEPIRVVTRLDVFENYTFTSFNIKKDDAGKYLGFTAVLQEVRIASPLFGTFTPEVEHTATPTTTALKEPEPLEEDPRSLLRQGVEARDGKSYGAKLQSSVEEAAANTRSSTVLDVSQVPRAANGLIDPSRLPPGTLINTGVVP